MKRWIHAATEYADNSDLGDEMDRWNTAHLTDDPELLERLSNDEEPSVRAAAVRNANVPVSVIVNLANDENKYVQEGVAKNERTPVDILVKLANHPDGVVRSEVASNKSTPSEIRKNLAYDEDWGVRARVAWVTDDPELLNKLANDENESVRSLAVNNRNNPNASHSKPNKQSSWKSILSQINEEIEEIDPLYEQTEAGSYILSLCEEVEESLNYYVEPSVQGGMGGVWIYDEANDNNVIVENYDFEDFDNEIIDLALNSKNKTDFKKKYKEYLLSLH